MRDKDRFLLFVGPTLFLFSLIALLWKVGFLLVSSVWTACFSLSTSLSAWITYLVLEEWWRRDKSLQRERNEKEKRGDILQDRLEEVQRLYLAKVKKLEEELYDEYGRREKVEEEYAQFRSQSAQTREEADGLRRSIEEALRELRHLRQLVFTWEEKQKTVPLNLIHKYEQLTEQFFEKTNRLDLMKKDLFHLESQLQLLLKEKKEDFGGQFSIEEVETILMGVLVERDQLKNEVAALEHLVSQPKKAASTAKKKIEKMVEMDLLSIDQR